MSGTKNIFMRWFEEQQALGKSLNVVMEPDCVDDGVAVRITNYRPITGMSIRIEANTFDDIADILSCFMIQLQLLVDYQSKGRDNTKEMQEALSKTFECLRHKIGSYGLTSVETNRSGMFETSVFTYGPIHEVKDDTQAEIDRLRERIRFLEQDVERAFSSIAELSTGGAGWKRPEKPAEPKEQTFGDGVPCDEPKRSNDPLKVWTLEKSGKYGALCDALDGKRFDHAFTDDEKYEFKHAFLYGDLDALLSKVHIAHQDKATRVLELCGKLAYDDVI